MLRLKQNTHRLLRRSRLIAMRSGPGRLWRRMARRVHTWQAAAFAGLMGVSTTAAADPFETFRDAMEDLAGGDFAIGVSILALILGCVMALGKMTVWPALIGLAVAAVFALGPYIIVQIFEWLA